MPRLALKPDSSFFRKIAIGAIGTRAVASDLTAYQHDMVELERGSTDTKLWKDVKRKRVRIPDLVCQRCGLRVESRAKTKAELAMSHSDTDEARSWDFGMVDTDCIAFPVCQALDEEYWSAGKLNAASSYWHERNWVLWQLSGRINYFTAAAFRATPHSRTGRKGVTEGSETTLIWDASFSNNSSVVEVVEGQRFTVRRSSDGRRQTRNVRPELSILIEPDDRVETNQITASTVRPLTGADLACPGNLPENHLAHLLSSRERTQRFTGVKLARLRNERPNQAQVAELANDEEEDIYIRLEALSYLASVCEQPVQELFEAYLNNPDDQTKLEAVIAVGETATLNAVDLLSQILDDPERPYFMRSAAAWCLGRAKHDEAADRLVRAFSDVDLNIREKALEGMVALGGPGIPILLRGLGESQNDVMAGCAEALRQLQPLEDEILAGLVNGLRTEENPSQWVIWLLGHLPRDQVSARIADLQESKPQLHYAISLLWSFVENWIARRWELNPGFSSTLGQENGNV
jgi:HEAT repeat protein